MGGGGYAGGGPDGGLWCVGGASYCSGTDTRGQQDITYQARQPTPLLAGG